MSEDRAAWQAHDEQLLHLGREMLTKLPGVSLMATPEHAVGVLTFTMTGAHPHDIASILDSRGICIRAGHHCAQLLMRHLHVPATSRASFAIYNDREDVDVLIEAIGHARKVFA